jgi:hypothetical protein
MICHIREDVKLPRLDWISACQSVDHYNSTSIGGIVVLNDIPSHTRTCIEDLLTVRAYHGQNGGNKTPSSSPVVGVPNIVIKL